MKKLVNDVHAVVRETLEGFALAHPDLVDVHYSPDFVTRRAPKAEGKVGLVSGGGSGHEPLHAGFVGEGMLDAAVPGAVFTSPPPTRFWRPPRPPITARASCISSRTTRATSSILRLPPSWPTWRTSRFPRSS